MPFTVNVTFAELAAWVKDVSSELTAQGYVIEWQLQVEPVRSLRMRAESPTALAEATLWEQPESAHLAVASMITGHFVFEEDGIQWSRVPLEETFREFLEHLRIT